MSCESVRLHGPGEVIALPVRTTELAKTRCLLHGFDALGDRDEVQGFAEPDDCVRQGFFLWSLENVVDEGFVDLEDLCREALEVGQRRVAGSEIVDGNTDAEPAQPPKPFEAGLFILDQHTFGHLENQISRI